MDIKYPSNGSKPSIHEGGTKVPSLDASFKKIVGVLLDMGTTHITIPPYNRLVSEAIAKQASATSSSSPSPSTSTASSPPSAQAHDSEAVTPLGKDLGWLLLCFFTQKTKIRVFLQDSVARKVGHILDEQVLRGQEGLYSRPTINDVPELTVALYKIDELHKYQVDGFHTVMWDCFQHAWDAAAGVHAGASALAHAADFLTDTVPPKPLVFGRMRLQIPNSFRYESAFGPVHFGPPSRSLKLFRDTDVPRVFVLPGNLFTSNREEGEAEYPALLNYYMLNSIFTRSEKVHVVGTKAQCEGLRQIYKECVTGPAHDEYFYSDDLSNGDSIDLEAERRELILNGTRVKEELMLDDFTEFHYLDDTTEEVEIELPYTSIRRIRAVSAAAAAAAATTVSSHGEDGPAAAKVPKPSGVLRIVQRAGLFLVYEDDELLGGLDGDFMVLRNADSDGVSAGYTENKAGFQPPGFGITFLGTDDIDVVGGSTNTTSGCVNSSGGGNIINNSNSNSSINNNNSNNNNNNNSNSIGSCCCCCSGTHHTGFIIWVGGTGVLVDPPPSTRAYLGAVGLRVNKVVLTHCHNEHDGGLAGMTFADERITVYSTRTIYESYVRKQLAISGRDVRGYQDFVAVRTGEPLAIGGAEFEFDYSLHTVPCLGFRVRYRGCAISYSGDTRYDPACFQAAVARGVMTPRREASLRMRGFDADLILHELGSGPFHTAACVLNDLPWDIKRKMLVVHCRDVPAAATDPQTGATVPVADLRAPRAGIEHTVALPLGDYEEGYATGSRRLQLICATPFLRGMYAPDLYGIFAAATEQSFPAGAVVIDGAAAASGRLYLISEGQAMMYSEEDKPITLNPRDMFGAFDGITTRIVAQTTLKVLSFSAEIFARLPRVGNEVLRMLKYRPFIQSSLAKSTVFKDLTQNQISVLSSCVSEEIVLAKNQTLIRQGDTSDRSLYIVRTGSIRVQLSNTNPPIEIARLGPGNCVGEMAVLLRKPRSADVIANEPIVVLRISQEAISDAMERYPYIRYALMDLVAHRSGRPTKSARPAERPMHMPPPPPGPFKKQQQQMMPPPPLPPPPSSQLSLTKTKDGDTGNNNNNNNNNNNGENIHIGTNFPKPPSQMISLPCIITNNNNNNNCNNGSDKKGVN